MGRKSEAACIGSLIAFCSPFVVRWLREEGEIYAGLPGMGRIDLGGAGWENVAV